ncbi:hypothetical protein MTP10_13545 [Nonomuraea sp. 3-1Str]|uniref:hypothetical protein n=1 Tax=Nonomuraea sp. 3-1Str TaxID=2929801 RepID=UPI00286146C3|nr:hypothetical protein [Nonomuraea sp. 3-1Str]MDR8409760.1 hypothetical protein [Nonomuraea sp. 3-1Str]
MATIQSASEIIPLLARLQGREIAMLQVLGINSLKTVSPSPEALAGELVTETDIAERSIRICTASHCIFLDLQRAGHVVFLESAEPHQLVAMVRRPTVRLLLADGSTLDFTEPSKTKRITVRIVGRSG